MTARDRRAAVRRTPEQSEPLSRVRVRAGHELLVVNVSSSGVLVEGEARLQPGRHVDVHVVARGGRTLVRSRVVRAWVAALWRDRVLYRAALAFERWLDLSTSDAAGPAVSRSDGNAFPSTPIEGPAQLGTHYPARAA